MDYGGQDTNHKDFHKKHSRHTKLGFLFSEFLSRPRC